MKLTTAAAAAALLGLAAMGTSAMAGTVVYNETSPLTLGSNYIEPQGGGSFHVVSGSTYYVDFTVPANDSLLTIYTNIVHNIPAFGGPVEDYSADTFQLFTGDVGCTGTASHGGTACTSAITGLGSVVTPTKTDAGLNAKIYDLARSNSPQEFVLKVITSYAPSDPNAKLNGSIQLGAVPEPATWAMAILGIGMIGLAARRRRETVAFA